MPWSSGNYTFPSLPGSWNPAVEGSPATPADWNTLAADLTGTTGLSNCITKDGQTTNVSANISLNNHKLTNVAAGTATTDAVNALQIQNDALNHCVDNSASGAAIVLVASPAISVFVTGMRISWTAAFTNASGATLSVNGNSITLEYPDTTTIPAGAIPAGAAVVAIFGVSAFMLQTVSVPAPFWQEIVTETFTSATGTTLVPWDDTIPQITEGDQYLTATITPKRTTSQVIIRVVFNYAHSTADQITLALFQGATTGAIAAASNWASAGGNPQQITLTHRISTIGTLSATTFTVRAGPNAGGTLTFNGAGGARKLGGVNASSITIEEVSP